jgi:hypothetical protein
MLSHRIPPIALSVASQPGVVTAGTQDRPSEDYHFKWLNERVQVHQRAFRIVQDVVVDASPQGRVATDMTALATKAGPRDLKPKS